MFSSSSRCISSLENLESVSRVQDGYSGHVLHKGVHNGLGNHIDHRALDDVEVRRYKKLCPLLALSFFLALMETY
jgi:hypothetical protein